MLDFGGKLYSMNTCRHIYLKFCARKRVDRNSSTRFCDTEKVGRCGGGHSKSSNRADDNCYFM